MGHHFNFSNNELCDLDEGEVRYHVRAYTRGRISCEAEICDMKRDGLYVEYYPSGQKKILTYYKNGKRNGPYTRFREDGSIFIHMSKD